MLETYRELENSHVGIPAIVAASGWSLRQLPDEFLARHFTIGVNASYKYYQERGLKLPDYLVSIDGRFPDKYKEVPDLFGDSFLHVRYPAIACKPDWPQITDYRLAATGGRIIADGTSSHAALHLALILGCAPIYLCGVDLCLSPEHEVYVTDEPLDQDKNTFKLSWEAMYDGFHFLASLTTPGRIMDCSPDGALKSFPKIKI